MAEGPRKEGKRVVGRGGRRTEVDGGIMVGRVVGLI
jgi:hypothetical protein